MTLVMYHTDRHTAFITLSSPETGNVVNGENLHLIKHYVEVANRDKDIRAIVLRRRISSFAEASRWYRMISESIIIAFSAFSGSGIRETIKLRELKRK